MKPIANKSHNFFRLLVLSALCSMIIFIPAAHSQQLKNEADGATLHVESGWRFLQTIGGLSREKSAEIVPGASQDIYAHYKAETGQAAINATVYIYSDKSEALDATYANAKLALLGNSESKPDDFFAEGATRVEGRMPLLGNKAIFKYGFGTTSSLEYLYFFDTGRWKVKIRVSAGRLQKDTFQLIDNFVRKQDWSSLNLAVDSCKGAACDINRAIPVHGPLAEMIVMATVMKGTEVMPSTKSSCTATELALVLANKPEPNPEDKNNLLQRLASCRLDKRAQLSLFRLTLPVSVLGAVEMESPEGISLRGPLTFFAYYDDKEIYLTQLHDGQIQEQDINTVLHGIMTNRSVDFATTDKTGKKTKPKLRLL